MEKKAVNEIESKYLSDKIKSVIKRIWKKDIANDYDYGWLLKEDTLKNSFYYHLRRKLGKLFDENNIRIFTEFTDGPFKGTNCRPDMVIAKVDLDKEGDCVIECIAVIEFKFKNGYNSSNSIFNDYKKLRRYVNKFKIDCDMYMVTIWEYEDDETSWESEKNKWAMGRLTELNASYERESKEIRFYIKEHK